jgi:predicted nucleotidyltransferase
LDLKTKLDIRFEELKKDFVKKKEIDAQTQKSIKSKTKIRLSADKKNDQQVTD